MILRQIGHIRDKLHTLAAKRRQLLLEMILDTDALSFGRYLRAKRIEKGIALETVSRDTRIGMEKLVCIEQENHQGLPAEVFVKGWLKSYARAIGADGEEVVRRYIVSIENVNRVAQSEAALEQSNAGFWSRLVLSILIMGVIVATTFFWVTRESTPPPQPVAAPASQQKDSAVEPQQAQEPEPIDKGQTSDNAVSSQMIETVPAPPVSPQKQFIKVTATEETWIKIIIDGKLPREFTLKPGDTLQLEAETGYNLLVGNATGIRLSLNDKEYPVPGKPGQVVTLKIP